ncbi:MAG: hypothetical protein FWD68_01850 [Alphaproteobacteria bacterium]|nr:hypothetical protein [Alphaproteobacteria bacterium]
MKSIVICLFVLLCFGGVELRAASLVEEINAKVEGIDKRIKDGDFGILSVEQKIESEGAPPSFSFYYDRGTERLIACEVSVGFETWSRQYFYYFDDNENVMKYLEVIPASTLGGPGPRREGMIFGKDEVLWTNLQQPPRQPPGTIKELYHGLMKASYSFSRWPQ